jgi:hypothetical protein
MRKISEATTATSGRAGSHSGLRWRAVTFPVKAFNLLALFGMQAIFAGFGTATLLFGGFFNVAANDPDPAIVD